MKPNLYNVLCKNRAEDLIFALLNHHNAKWNTLPLCYPDKLQVSLLSKINRVK